MFPTIHSRYRQLEAYLAQFEARSTSPPAVRITALDAFLLQQIAATYPQPPTVLDLAALPTLGASTAMWTDSESTVRQIIPLQASWQSRDQVSAETAASYLGDLPGDLDMTFFDDLADHPDSAHLINDALVESYSRFLLLAQPEMEGERLVERMETLCELYRPQLIFFLPLGPVGTSANLAALIQLCRPGFDYRLMLLRELNPFFAKSMCALLYCTDLDFMPSLLDRLDALFRGNFDYLSLAATNANLNFRLQGQAYAPTQSAPPPHSNQRNRVAAALHRLRTVPRLRRTPSLPEARLRKPFAHRVYGRLRPMLKQVGVLRVARRLFGAEVRERVAVRLGLEGFDRSDGMVSAPIPKRPASYPFRNRSLARSLKLDGINYVADLKADVGLSESARHLWQAIQRQMPTAYHEIPVTFASRSREHPAELAAEAPYSFTIAHVNPSEFVYMLEEVDQSLFAPEKYVIAIWYWELPEFPRKWHWLFDLLDEIWVASSYMQHLMAAAAPIPVTKIVLPVAAEINPTANSRRF